MKSNVCKIENGTKDLAAILKESERVAEYNGFSHKQSLQLRLLCEELDGMLPKIIDKFEGNIWIEYDDGVCKVKASVEIPEINTNKKDELINISTSKKNATAVGIVGKIRNAVENIFFNEDLKSSFVMSAAMVSVASGYTSGENYSCVWSLDQYRSTVNQDKQAEAWDELEKSVIASVADDVIVGVKGKSAEIVIIKKFA